MTSGYWRFETEWPLKRHGAQTFYLGAGTLGPVPSEAEGLTTIDYHATVGSTLRQMCTRRIHQRPRRVREVAIPAAGAPAHVVGTPRADDP